MQRRKPGIVFHIGTIIGILMMESPILLTANRVEPIIFGFPFLISWILFWWSFCCVILFVAYRSNWGKNKK